MGIHDRDWYKDEKQQRKKTNNDPLPQNRPWRHFRNGPPLTWAVIRMRLTKYVALSLCFYGLFRLVLDIATLLRS